MTLTVDLQSQDHTDYFMAFFIFSCIYDINWIYMSIPQGRHLRGLAGGAVAPQEKKKKERKKEKEKKRRKKKEKREL